MAKQSRRDDTQPQERSEAMSTERRQYIESNPIMASAHEVSDLLAEIERLRSDLQSAREAGEKMRAARDYAVSRFEECAEQLAQTVGALRGIASNCASVLGGNTEEIIQDCRISRPPPRSPASE